MLYIYIYVITLFPSNSLFRYIRYSVKASIYIQENYKYKPKKIYHSGKSRHKHWAKFKTGSFSQVKPVYFPKPVCRPQFGRQGGIQHRINRFSPSASPSFDSDDELDFFDSSDSESDFNFRLSPSDELDLSFFDFLGMAPVIMVRIRVFFSSLTEGIHISF